MVTNKIYIFLVTILLIHIRYIQGIYIFEMYCVWRIVNMNKNQDRKRNLTLKISNEEFHRLNDAWISAKVSYNKSDFIRIAINQLAGYKVFENVSDES